MTVLSLSTLLTAPLTTAHISLQLSIPKTLFKDLGRGTTTSFSGSKELVNMPKDITLAMRKKFELMVKTGADGQRAFRAPAYLGYKETFNALKNQGFLAFYKGNMYGNLHYIISNYFKFNLIWPVEGMYLLHHTEMNKISRSCYYILTGCLVDMGLQPLHL